MVAHTPVGEGLAPPVCHGAMSYMREEQAPPLPMLQQLSSYNPALVILSVAFSRSSFRASVEESCARKRSRTFETSSQKRVAGSRGGAAIESRRISGGDVRSINIHFYTPRYDKNAVYLFRYTAFVTFSYSKRIGQQICGAQKCFRAVKFFIGESTHPHGKSLTACIFLYSIQ